MIQVTEKAAEELSAMLKKADERPEKSVLRLGFSSEGKPVLGWGVPQEKDREVTHEQETVLVVDPVTDELLERAVMDVEDSPEGPKLTLRQTPGEEEAKA